MRAEATCGSPGNGLSVEEFLALPALLSRTPTPRRSTTRSSQMLRCIGMDSRLNTSTQTHVRNIIVTTSDAAELTRQELSSYGRAVYTAANAAVNNHARLRTISAYLHHCGNWSRTNLWPSFMMPVWSLRVHSSLTEGDSDADVSNIHGVPQVG